MREEPDYWIVPTNEKRRTVRILASYVHKRSRYQNRTNQRYGLKIVLIDRKEELVSSNNNIYFYYLLNLAIYRWF
jgi:hypothetical protein